MPRGARLLVIGALLALLVVAGCQPEADSTARFVRYTTLPDGTHAIAIAIPATGSPSEEQIASTDLTDLKAGDTVDALSIGKSWDEPQWRPSLEVVGRSAK